ncbi:DNA replication/repair protein RecF [Salinisphaera sp. USBA-960]|nr:DNA replication/repair protein RecF [Salifodinibacter halophilus]NNC27074.1 DNA replication/repair protein RecF [Salifodinibacter halophilus]
MYFETLALRAFRCFESLNVEATPGVNVLLGDNAVGKSSVLEALFLLARGESFRQTGFSDRIRDGQSRFRVQAGIRDERNLGRSVSVEGAGNRTQLHLDAESNTTRLDLVQAIPLQLIDPNVHRLMTEGPRFRRRFLDWGVFHVEHSFFGSWQRFRRALKQRNRALRHAWPKKDVVAWDAILIREAEHLDACRRAHVDAIADALPQSIRDQFGHARIRFHYRPGWPVDENFDRALARTLDRDQKAGFTQVGPHRADLRIKLDQVQARNQVSRGQQKLLTTALLLAQARVMYGRRGLSPVLLVDDIAAELGQEYRDLLGKELAALGSQVFITFLDAASVPEPLASGRRITLATSDNGATVI